jgi:hypothetical protein
MGKKGVVEQQRGGGIEREDKQRKNERYRDRVKDARKRRGVTIEIPIYSPHYI